MTSGIRLTENDYRVLDAVAADDEDIRLVGRSVTCTDSLASMRNVTRRVHRLRSAGYVDFDWVFGNADEAIVVLTDQGRTAVDRTNR